MKTSFAQTVRSFLAPIITYIDDDEISEIMINSHQEIWIEKKGRIFKTDAIFKSEEELVNVLNEIEQLSLSELGKSMKDIALKYYNWADIAEKYACLFGST